MSLSRVPLPSFALVLTSDVVFLPTRPSVIKVGFDPLRTVYPAASAHEHASNHPNDIQIRQCDTVATAEEHSLLDVLNDSATDIGKSENNNESEEKLTTSRGSYSNKVKLEFMTLATAIRKLLRAIPKSRTPRVERKVDTQQ